MMITRCLYKHLQRLLAQSRKDIGEFHFFQNSVKDWGGPVRFASWVSHGRRNGKICPKVKILQNRPFSGSQEAVVTVENVFSRPNKLRVQSTLMMVRPVREPSRSEAKPRAAVLVPLCIVNGEPSVLFTLRCSDMSSHSGHVSFPGGKMDPSDRDLIHTAIRETEEELGLSENDVDIWGALLPSPTKGGTMMVTPVLGFCGEIRIDKLTPSRGEVEEVFARTIKSLCNMQNLRYTRFRAENGIYTLPVYLGGDHRIWGLTAVILHQTLTLLAPQLYTYKIRHYR